MKFHFIVRDRAFYRKVLRIAVPIALQSLITIGVNMMDTVMISSMGETQLSATSLANQFVNVYQVFTMGLAMGASVVGKGLALKILDTFLAAQFEGGRHATRVDLISDIERRG